MSVRDVDFLAKKISTNTSTLSQLGKRDINLVDDYIVSIML